MDPYVFIWKKVEIVDQICISLIIFCYSRDIQRLSIVLISESFLRVIRRSKKTTVQKSWKRKPLVYGRKPCSMLATSDPVRLNLGRRELQWDRSLSTSPPTARSCSSRDRRRRGRSVLSQCPRERGNYKFFFTCHYKILWDAIVDNRFVHTPSFFASSCVISKQQ